MMPSSANRTWKLREPDENLVGRLVRKAGLSDPVARILINRGISSEREAKEFLNPLLGNLLKPDSLPDIDTATERIIRAIRDKEKIVVYGDYDADGITATALLVSFLESVGASVRSYQPDRRKEGYGLNVQALESLRNDGTALVIAVDLGVADAEAVDWANSHGLDVIVVDHHKLPDKLPEALAVIDPLRSGKAEPFNLLSGVGLAFYLAGSVKTALGGEEFFSGTDEIDLRRYLDLVTLGTVADMMPLVGLNRILVTHGLKELGAERKPGIAALKAQSKLGRKRVAAGQVAFQLGPRLNAAGRMGDAALAVKLLITDDAKEARGLAKRLENFNRERQQVEARILAEAMNIIEEKDLKESPAIVLASERWHPGVVGIVASRIVDAFAVPTIVISLDGDNGKGSVRSVRGVNAWQMLRECSDYLERYGGHEMAGGLFIKRDAVDTFRRRFCEAVSELKIEVGARELAIDMELDFEDVDVLFVRQLEKLAPYGIGNPEPLFFIGNVKCESVRIVGEKHVKFRVKSGRAEMDAIAFGLAERAEMLAGRVDLAFTPKINTWENWERLEIRVKDFRPVDKRDD